VIVIVHTCALVLVLQNSLRKACIHPKSILPHWYIFCLASHFVTSVAALLHFLLCICPIPSVSDKDIDYYKKPRIRNTYFTSLQLYFLSLRFYFEVAPLFALYSPYWFPYTFLNLTIIILDHHLP
jgi:hypothetical protein